MGGGGGILGSITSLLFGKPKNPTISVPEPAVPAPPAPTAKTDTGAIIQTGALDSANDRLPSRSTAVNATRRSSTLGSLGRGGW